MSKQPKATRYPTSRIMLTLARTRKLTPFQIAKYLYLEGYTREDGKQWRQPHVKQYFAERYPAESFPSLGIEAQKPVTDPMHRILARTLNPPGMDAQQRAELQRERAWEARAERSCNRR